MIRKIALLVLLVFCFVPVIRAESLFDIVSAKDSTVLLKLMQAIKAGADVNEPDEDGVSLLARAIVTNCDRMIIEALLNAGARMTPDSEKPVMMFVSSFCSDEMLLKLLVSHGYKIDADFVSNSTFNENFRVFKTAMELYGKGIVVNEKGFSLLHRAATIARNPQVVQYLLELGMRVNDATIDGAVPVLFAASFNPNEKIIETLIRAGANLETRGLKNRTALLCAAYRNTNPAVAISLIKSGAKVNVTDEDGATPLMYASRTSGNEELVKALVEAGADVNMRDNNGFSPLMQAAFNVRPEIIRCLIDAGARTDFKDKEQGLTALDYARKNEFLRDSDVLKLLE